MDEEKSEKKQNSTSSEKIKQWEIINPNITFIKELGSGSFGSVWQAKETKTFAIKIMKYKRKIEIEAWKKDVTNELKIMRTLNKANTDHIVKYIKVNSDFPYVFIYLEFCNGGDVSHFAKTHDIDLIDFCKQVLLGLKIMHEYNITHSDIKTQNIMVAIGEKITYKIGDFGTAFIGEATGLAGTPDFMAPEMLNDEYNYTNKVDVWALGVSMYILTTGDQFCKNLNEILSLNESTIKSKISDIVVAQPTIKNIIEKLLTFNPQERPSAEQMIRELPTETYMRQKGTILPSAYSLSPISEIFTQPARLSLCWRNSNLSKTLPRRSLVSPADSILTLRSI